MRIDLGTCDKTFFHQGNVECYTVKGKVLHFYGVSGNHYFCEYPTEEKAKEDYNKFTSILKEVD